MTSGWTGMCRQSNWNRWFPPFLRFAWSGVPCRNGRWVHGYFDLISVHSDSAHLPWMIIKFRALIWIKVSGYRLKSAAKDRRRKKWAQTKAWPGTEWSTIFNWFTSPVTNDSTISLGPTLWSRERKSSEPTSLFMSKVCVRQRDSRNKLERSDGRSTVYSAETENWLPMCFSILRNSQKWTTKPIYGVTLSNESIKKVWLPHLEQQDLLIS